MFSLKNTDSVKQSEPCYTEHPFNDEGRLTEKTIKQAAAILNQGKKLQRS